MPHSMPPAEAAAAAAAARVLMSLRPPVSTGHSFSPPSAAHSFIQRAVTTGRYRPLPGMVGSSRRIT